MDAHLVVLSSRIGVEMWPALLNFRDELPESHRVDVHADQVAEQDDIGSRSRSTSAWRNCKSQHLRHECAFESTFRGCDIVVASPFPYRDRKLQSHAVDLSWIRSSTVRLRVKSTAARRSHFRKS